MTTRATLENGETFDYDEETCAHPTHVNDQPVVSRAYVGPTPPPAVPAERSGDENETTAQRRARLQAQLDALGDDT